MQSNGQPLSQPDGGKPKGNYTGERLKVLRPETYRKVVELLAEPREHVSIREICRQCHVTDDTVKAVERREAIPIAARKQALMVQAARIAKLAYDRVEDQIDSAPLPQAVVTAGVFTDKLQLLSGDATAHAFNLNVKLERVDLVEQFNRLHAAIRAENASMTQKQLALPPGDTIADLGAETGPDAGKAHREKRPSDRMTASAARSSSGSRCVRFRVINKRREGRIEIN
jgi:hypothetical protein